jgi:hypothetical protein
MSEIPETRYDQILDRLCSSGVDFILFGEVAGGGNYSQLLPFSESMEIFGQRCSVVTLEKLIQLKRAAGRLKDLEPIAELEALLEERRRLE